MPVETKWAKGELLMLAGGSEKGVLAVVLVGKFHPVHEVGREEVPSPWEGGVAERLGGMLVDELFHEPAFSTEEEKDVCPTCVLGVKVTAGGGCMMGGPGKEGETWAVATLPEWASGGGSNDEEGGWASTSTGGGGGELWRRKSMSAAESTFPPCEA